MDHTCHRHDGVVAVGACHSCGKHFCEECLTDGLENRYCTDSDCQAQMARDEALILRRNNEVEEQIQLENQGFDGKVFKFQLALWIVSAPILVYFGSDHWTRDHVVASVMGIIGSLAVCLQLRTLILYFRRKQLDKRRLELMRAWVPNDAE